MRTAPGNATTAPIVLRNWRRRFRRRHMVSALTQAGWHVRCAQRSVGPTSSTADIVTGPLLEYQSKIKPSPDLLPDAAVAFLNEIRADYEKKEWIVSEPI